MFTYGFFLGGLDPFMSALSLFYTWHAQFFRCLLWFPVFQTLWSCYLLLNDKFCEPVPNWTPGSVLANSRLPTHTLWPFLDARFQKENAPRPQGSSKQRALAATSSGACSNSICKTNKSHSKLRNLWTAATVVTAVVIKISNSPPRVSFPQASCVPAPNKQINIDKHFMINKDKSCQNIFVHWGICAHSPRISGLVSSIEAWTDWKYWSLVHLAARILLLCHVMSIKITSVLS